MSLNPFKTILELVAKEQVEPALLAQVDYLRAENKFLHKQLKGEKLTDTQRGELAKLAYKMKEFNKELLDLNVTIVKPATILEWHRKFVRNKFDGSKNRQTIKIKRITKEIEAEIVRIALEEDKKAGYGKIAGYLEDLGISFSKTTIKKILKKHGIDPAPDREFDLTWKEFINVHANIMWGCDFFTHEVWSKAGLVTYYVLVFIHLGTRRLEIVNMTQNPTEEWTIQQARNFLYDMDACSEKANMRYLIHDRGSQFTKTFDKTFTKNELGEDIETKTVTCAQMNGRCERVIQSIQNECADKIIFLGERMLRYALKEYQNFYNTERHHQGIDNVIPFPSKNEMPLEGKRKCKTRLGGLLRKYYLEAG